MEEYVSASMKRLLDWIDIKLSDKGCRLQTFMAGNHTQYVIKGRVRNVSPSFDSLYEMVIWLSKNYSNMEDE